MGDGFLVMSPARRKKTMDWPGAGVGGTQRYLPRLWNFAHGLHAEMRTAGAINAASLDAAAKKLRHEIHAALKQANYDYTRLQYNTVVSACMKMLNALEENRSRPPSVLREGLSILLRVLYPACPHITWQIWNDLGYWQEFGDLLDALWPEPDPAALEQDEIEMVVQVNGKLRGQIRVPKQAGKEAIEKLALDDEGVKRHTEGKPVKKLIVVPGKLINVVV